MKQKYWYQEGMCRALGYKGQYPVIYKSEDGLVYTKECMACNAISEGKCKSENCEVYDASPTEMENTWELRDKKMG